MIRITKQTDYGIVLMTHLAQTPDGQHSAPELAEELRIPLPMVSKILKILAREALLASHRGVNGGYSLARPPAEITVDQIVGSLEGPIAMTECVEDHHDCAREAFCSVRGNWQVINRAIQGALQGISLADMLRPIPEQRRLVSIGASRVSLEQR
ncbi:MAG: SUF system Fe-S cluster assembly regulator [Acidobacteriota bacterium]